MGIWNVIFYGAILLGVADVLIPKRYKKRLNDLVAELWFKLSAFTYREVALKASSRALMYMSTAFRNEQGIVRVKLIAVIFIIAYSIPLFTTMSSAAFNIYYLDDDYIQRVTGRFIESMEGAVVVTEDGTKLINPNKIKKIDKVISYFEENGRDIAIEIIIFFNIYYIFYSVITNIAPSIALGTISILATLYLLERARFYENPISLVIISIVDLIFAFFFAFISMEIVIFLANDLNAYLSLRFQEPSIVLKIAYDIEISWRDYISLKIFNGPNPSVSDMSSISSLTSMIVHSMRELVSGNIQIGVFEAFLNYNMLLSLFPTIFHLSLISLLISLKFFDFILRKPMLFTLEWINGHEKGPVAVVAVLVGAGAKLIEKAVS